MWHSWRQNHCRLHQRQFHVSQPFLKRQPSVGCGGSIAWFRERTLEKPHHNKIKKRIPSVRERRCSWNRCWPGQTNKKRRKDVAKWSSQAWMRKFCLQVSRKLGQWPMPLKDRSKIIPKSVVFCNLVTYQNVANGGPPFQIDGSVLTQWLQCTRTQCPVILRHVLNFFQSWVCFDPNRSQPVSKEQLQPLLRSHAWHI